MAPTRDSPGAKMSTPRLELDGHSWNAITAPSNGAADFVITGRADRPDHRLSFDGVHAVFETDGGVEELGEGEGEIGHFCEGAVGWNEGDFGLMGMDRKGWREGVHLWMDSFSLAVSRHTASLIGLR